AKNVQVDATGGGISVGLVSALVLVVLGLGVGALLLVARAGGASDWTTDDVDVAAVVDAALDEI
ncbi:MAG: hypothetical protein QF839_05530, partial [Candidatus Poseidoniaceae archaeon]|nr:hypothetical protein [Candidatus Poseidoniaceae archaeon]